MITKIWLRLKGKKTYLVALASLIYAITGMATGHVATSDGINIILFALGGSGLRDAINSSITNSTTQQQ